MLITATASNALYNRTVAWKHGPNCIYRTGSQTEAQLYARTLTHTHTKKKLALKYSFTFSDSGGHLLRLKSPIKHINSCWPYSRKDHKSAVSSNFSFYISVLLDAAYFRSTDIVAWLYRVTIQVQTLILESSVSVCDQCSTWWSLLVALFDMSRVFAKEKSWIQFLKGRSRSHLKTRPHHCTRYMLWKIQ